MQSLLSELDEATLQLLLKISDKALSGEEKFQVLKRNNDVCQTKIFQVPRVMQVLKIIGFNEIPEGLKFEGEARVLENAITAINTAIAQIRNKSAAEYEERKKIAEARAFEIQRKQEYEAQQKEQELKKIKSIQSDVKERPVLASHADVTMGRSSAAAGIFSGAGGKSSTAKTFKDIGVSLN